jgi:hypothetical protein
VTATRKRKIQVDIRNHPASSDHKQVIVTTARGYSFTCTWAEPFPDEETVRQAWSENRKNFAPYNAGVQ